ncbi:MAG: Fic/DOC family protein, partial [Pseudomonas sp.]
MLDKYGVGQDPYCYPGSSVLRNRLDLFDEERLHQAERELSEIAVGSLPLYPPPYDLERLQHIHRTLFADIYEWAGELRTVNIQKGDTLFCTPERIPPEASKIIQHMAQANWFVGVTQAELV